MVRQPRSKKTEEVEDRKVEETPNKEEAKIKPPKKEPKAAPKATPKAQPKTPKPGVAKGKARTIKPSAEEFKPSSKAAKDADVMFVEILNSYLKFNFKSDFEAASKKLSIAVQYLLTHPSKANVTAIFEFFKQYNTNTLHPQSAMAGLGAVHQPDARNRVMVLYSYLYNITNPTETTTTKPSIDILRRALKIPARKVKPGENLVNTIISVQRAMNL